MLKANSLNICSGPLQATHRKLEIVVFLGERVKGCE
jgi:hypothetical protein